MNREEFEMAFDNIFKRAFKDADDRNVIMKLVLHRHREIETLINKHEHSGDLEIDVLSEFNTLQRLISNWGIESYKISPIDDSLMIFFTIRKELKI